MADRQYTVLLCQNAKNAEELIAKGGITATVEFAFGDRVYGDPAYDHHGSRSDNPSPCNDPSIQPVDHGTFAVNHIDADCLGGLMALMGRKPDDPEFWAGVEYIDNHGPQHITEMPEAFQDRMNAFYAWNYRDGLEHPQEILNGRTATVDITPKVERAADAFEVILGERTIYRTEEAYLQSIAGKPGDHEVMFEDGATMKITGGPDRYYDQDGRGAAESLHTQMIAHGGILSEAERMVEEGRRWHADVEKATQSKLIYETDNVRVFSTDRVNCSSAYYSPTQDKVIPATLVYNERFNSITLAFYDGGRDHGGQYSAQEIMQSMFGPMAGGHDGIAGSPRGEVMAYEDLARAADIMDRVYEADKERAAGRDPGAWTQGWDNAVIDMQVFKVNHTIDSKEVVPELKDIKLSPEGYSYDQRKEGVPSVSVYRETYRVGNEAYSREGFAYTDELDRKTSLDKVTPVTDRGFALDGGDNHARQEGVERDAAYVMLKGDKALENWSEQGFASEYWYMHSVGQAADYLKENAAEQPYTYAEQHPEEARVAIANGNDWYWNYQDEEAFQHMDLRDLTGNLIPSADEKGWDAMQIGAGEQAIPFDKMDPEPKHAEEDYTLSRVTAFIPVKDHPEIAAFREEQFMGGERISSREGFAETSRLMAGEAKTLFGNVQPDEKFVALKDSRAMDEWRRTDGHDLDAVRDFMDRGAEEKPYTAIVSALDHGREPDVKVATREGGYQFINLETGVKSVAPVVLRDLDGKDLTQQPITQERGAFTREPEEFTRLRDGMEKPGVEYEVYCSYYRYDKVTQADSFEKVYFNTKASELDAIRYAQSEAELWAPDDRYWTIKEVPARDPAAEPKDIPNETIVAEHWHEDSRWRHADKDPEEVMEAARTPGSDYEVYRNEFNEQTHGYDQTHVATYSKEEDAYHFIRENSWKWEQEYTLFTVREVDRELDLSLTNERTESQDWGDSTDPGAGEGAGAGADGQDYGQGDASEAPGKHESEEEEYDR